MKFRFWFWFLSGSVGVLLVASLSSALWLPWIAFNLVVEDQLRPADLIVVFAAKKERTRHAARLYQKGLSPRILVTGGQTLRSVEVFCHKKVTGAELSAKILTGAGVPESAVVVIPRGTSTYEEGEAIKAFMENKGYRSAIAVSSSYHMRRVRATLDHLFRKTEIKMQYSAAEGTDFRPKEWWRREKDLIHVTNEYLKLAYYHIALF